MKCKYCNKEFKSEKYFEKHKCISMKRLEYRNEKYFKIGYDTFFHFFKTKIKHKNLTLEKYIKSNQYSYFEKFGKYIIESKVINYLDYIDYIVSRKISIYNWAKDETYKNYIIETYKKETFEKGIEKSLLVMQTWAQETNNEWYDFFRKIGINSFIFYITLGKISPWIIYLTDSGNDLIAKLEDYHLKLINEYIDPLFWYRKIKIKQKDVKYIKEILKNNGL